MSIITFHNEAQIIDDFMESIMSGSLIPGAKLPSENNLADKYCVPRMTVRKALSTLEERGYIYSAQGKGRYLKEKSVQIQLHLDGKTSFTEKMMQSGLALRTENFCCEKINPGRDMYQGWHRAEDEGDIYKIGRLRFIGGEPIALHYSFVSDRKFPGIAEEGPKVQSMFAYYRRHGYKTFSSSKRLLSVAFPDSTEQNLLLCGNTVPLIVLESNCLDADSNEMLEQTRILYRSDKFKYIIPEN